MYADSFHSINTHMSFYRRESEHVNSLILLKFLRLVGCVVLNMTQMATILFQNSTLNGYMKIKYDWYFLTAQPHL
jgi:hypothetical protein